MTTINENKYEFSGITINGTPIAAGTFKSISYDANPPEVFATVEPIEISASGSIECSSEGWDAFMKAFLPPRPELSKYWARREVYRKKNWLKVDKRYKHAIVKLSHFAATRLRLEQDGFSVPLPLV